MDVTEKGGSVTGEHSSKHQTPRRHGINDTSDISLTSTEISDLPSQPVPKSMREGQKRLNTRKMPVPRRIDVNRMSSPVSPVRPQRRSKGPSISKPRKGARGSRVSHSTLGPRPAAQGNQILSAGDSPRSISGAVEYVKVESEMLLRKYDEVIDEVTKRHWEAEKYSDFVGVHSQAITPPHLHRLRPTLRRQSTDTEACVDPTTPFTPTSKPPLGLLESQSTSPPDLLLTAQRLISRVQPRRSRSFDHLPISMRRTSSEVPTPFPEGFEVDRINIEEMQARRRFVEDICNKQIETLMARLEEVQRKGGSPTTP